LSGTPTVPGTTTLSLEVVDSAKPTPLNASASVSFQVVKSQRVVYEVAVLAST
jgi:hypothetical protein